METQENKKVLCLICTCMDSNSGLSTHTAPFCSAVIVPALKNNNLSWLLHHPSLLNQNSILNYHHWFSCQRGSKRSSTHVIKLAFQSFLSFEHQCLSVMKTLCLSPSSVSSPVALDAGIAKVSSCKLLGAIWPLDHITFTYRSFNICTVSLLISVYR